MNALPQHHAQQAQTRFRMLVWLMVICLSGASLLLAQENPPAPTPAPAAEEEVIEVKPQASEPAAAPAAETPPAEEKPAATAAEAPEIPDDKDLTKEEKEVKEKVKTLADEAPVVPIELKEGSGPVYVIPLKGTVDHATFSFARRIIKQAQRDDARAIIIDMDTPGGKVSTCLEYIQMLNKLGMPTYTYVNPNAISAGSLIAIGTRHIYMAPLSAIGAAAIVSGGGEDLDSTMNDKMVSILTALVRTTAERNGHNPQIAQAFINKEIEVMIGDVQVSAKGSLLSLGANEATRVIDGKPVLAAGMANDMEDLITKAGLTGSEVVYAQPTGFERLGLLIAEFSWLLILIGMAGIFIEFQTPGFGVPGIVGASALAVFFLGQYVVGLAESELVVLFILGALLVLVELFLLPGTIIPLVSGVLLMVASLFLAMVDKWPTDTSWLPVFGDLLRPALNLTIGLVGAAVLIAVMGAFLPKTPLFGRLALADTIAGNTMKGLAGDPDAGSASGASAARISVGMEGTAESSLRPAGKVRMGALLVDVQSDGRWVEKGSRVRVRSVEGSTVVVDPVEPA